MSAGEIERIRVELADEAGRWLTAAGVEVPSPVEVWSSYAVALDRLGYPPAVVLAFLCQPALRGLLYAGDWPSGTDCGILAGRRARPAGAVSRP